MIPKEFDYVAPESLEEALKALEEGGEEAKVLAGGHSLIPLMKLRLAEPALLVDLRKIKELQGLNPGNGSHIEIGAMTTHQALNTSSHLMEMCPIGKSADLAQRTRVLTEAAALIADVQVRNRGTLCGSLAHADPAGDPPAVVYALDAQFQVQGANGARTVAVDDWFVDTLQSALEPDEVLTEVRLAVPGARSGSAYRKFEQPASHYALVGAAVVLTMGEDGTCSEASVAITGAASKPFRLDKVEGALRGSKLDEESIRKAVGMVDEVDADWMSDLYGSEEYRRHLAGVATSRAIEMARRRIKSQ